MNFHKRTFYLPVFYLVFLIFPSCKKEYLALKSDKVLVIPSTLKDLQAIADNTAVMTGDTRNGITPLLGELGSDNHLYTEDTWLNLNVIEKNSYIWIKDIFAPTSIINDWNDAYRAAFYCNVVLQGIEKFSDTGNPDLDQLKGSVLFYRAHAFFQILQIFAKPYDLGTAVTDLGIPLPLKASVTTLTSRSNIADGYKQVLQDLENAFILLPDVPLYKTRPCKAAVLGLRSRIYLIMGNFDQALNQADEYLKIKSQLLDFNKINLTIARPIPGIINPETTFFSAMSSYGSTEPPTTLVTPLLYELYSDNDLRKIAYFKVSNQEISYKLGNYTAGYSYFSGIATGEILLIRAECQARKNNKTAALEDLNKLRINRISTAGYADVLAATADHALDLILLERRLELCFRGLRWMDLRRLNKDPKFAITLTRVIGGNTYTLPPDDARYVYPIPATETDYNPLLQNLR